jgi:hypothetical protein
LNVNSFSWIKSECSRFLLRRLSGGWFYIKILTGMLMLSELYLLAIFNLQIYIMLKLLVSRQLKRTDYKLWSVFIYTEWSTVQTKGRGKRERKRKYKTRGREREKNEWVEDWGNADKEEGKEGERNPESEPVLLGFGSLIAVTRNNTDFLVATLCSSETVGNFGGTYRLHPQGGIINLVRN